MGVQVKLGANVTGYPDVDAILKKLTPSRFNSIMNTAMNSSSKPMQQAMKNNAPKWSGALSKTMGYRRFKTNSRKYGIAGRVGTIFRKGKGKSVASPLAAPPNSSQNYGALSIGARPKLLQWPESGVKPHIIRPKRAKTLVFKSKSGEWIFAKQIRHPGQKGQKFMAKSKSMTQSAISKNFSNQVARATANNIKRFLRRKKIKIV